MDVVEKLETLLNMSNVSANVKGVLDVSAILLVVAGSDYTEQAMYLEHMATKHNIEDKYSTLRLAKLYRGRAKLMEQMFNQLKQINHDR